jgi:hypothetical protein
VELSRSQTKKRWMNSLRADVDTALLVLTTFNVERRTSDPTRMVHAWRPSVMKNYYLATALRDEKRRQE